MKIFIFKIRCFHPNGRRNSYQNHNRFDFQDSFYVVKNRFHPGFSEKNWAVVSFCVTGSDRSKSNVDFL